MPTSAPSLAKRDRDRAPDAAVAARDERDLIAQLPAALLFGVVAVRARPHLAAGLAALRLTMRFVAGTNAVVHAARRCTGSVGGRFLRRERADERARDPRLRDQLFPDLLEARAVRPLFAATSGDQRYRARAKRGRSDDDTV